MFSDCHISDSENTNLIFIEPFYGGSHKQLIDTLRERMYI